MKIRREERKDGGGTDEVTVKCFSHKEKKRSCTPSHYRTIMSRLAQITYNLRVIITSIPIITDLNRTITHFIYHNHSRVM